MTRPWMIAVVGPTAAGKSQLALDLAAALGGEVVNADAMQLYRGMDIGTAKLAAAERRGITHHLLDVWPVTEPASVAAYQRLAGEAVADLRARGVPVVLVGGSGLYVRAALGDLDIPGTDPVLRAELERRLERVGPSRLHEQLAATDPAAAAAILPSNGRRIVRALEVLAVSGRPFAARLPAYRPVSGIVQVGVDRPLAELDQRIADRVRRMFAAGLVDEVAGLVGQGLRCGRTARRAVGYAEVLRLLAGELSEQEARTQIVRATRRLVRRQRSWFRRDPRIVWMSTPRPPDEVLAAIGKSGS